MNKTEGVLSRALADPTVAKANDAFMKYHFKDYGGAAKDAKDAGTDLYRRLKKALKRGKAGASESFLAAEDYVDPKHPYHSLSDEKLKHIVAKSGAAAKTSHARGEGGTVGKFFDKEADTASAILKKRQRDKGWG